MILVEDHLRYEIVVCIGIEKTFRAAKNGELSSNPQVDTDVHDTFSSPHTSWISLYDCVELNTELMLNKAVTAFARRGFRYSYDGKNVCQRWYKGKFHESSRCLLK